MSLLDRLVHARALDRLAPKTSPRSRVEAVVPPVVSSGFERRERAIELMPSGNDERPSLLGGCLGRIALPSASALARDLVCLGAREAGHAVFIDSETTGLGGATVPFMLGMAWIEGAHLHCMQWTMTRVSGEAELLADVLARLEAHGPAPLVSFNGASFDLPLLRLRAHHHGLSARVLDAEHIDLLHPARRLHRGRARDCRLATLEHELLGLRRRGDIDSAEIPEVFWRWVQSPTDIRAQRRLRAVGEHNLVDLVSLPALATALADGVREPSDLDRALRAARHLDRIGAADQARSLLSRWVEAEEACSSWREAALVLAELERRAGVRERAAALWRAAWLADPGCPEASEAWAKHLEHRVGDFAEALQVARGSRDPCERRIARLEARVARAAERAPRLASGPANGPPPHVASAPRASGGEPTELLTRIGETDAGVVVRYRLLR